MKCLKQDCGLFLWSLREFLRLRALTVASEIKCLFVRLKRERERERERDRQTERETERETDRERDRESVNLKF